MSDSYGWHQIPEPAKEGEERCDALSPSKSEQCELKKGHEYSHYGQGWQWKNTLNDVRSKPPLWIKCGMSSPGGLDKCTLEYEHEGQHKSGPYSWPNKSEIPTQKGTPMKSIKEEVASSLAERIPQVRNTVILSLVEVEQKTRVDAVIKVLSDIDSTRKELYRFKPKSPGYDAEGKELPGIMSREDFEGKKKVQEKLDRLEKALNKAVGDEPNKDFTDVIKLAFGEKKKEE